MNVDDELLLALDSFRKSINNKDSMRSVINGWDRSILIHCHDSNELFTTTVSSKSFGEIKKITSFDDDQDIQIIGSKVDLLNVFNGKSSTAMSLLEGKISVYASTQDQIKLDAILLHLWG